MTAAVAALACLPASAGSLAGQPTEWKAELGHYFYAGQGDGTDINLRARRGPLGGWVAYYGDPTFGAQWRVGAEWRHQGWDDRLLLISTVHASLSGFAASAFTAQVGRPWYLIAGVGRTNGREFYNLDFNPNDMVTLGAGWSHRDLEIDAFDVRDNRFGTGRRYHLVVRKGDPHDQLWTMDLARQTGPDVDGVSMHAWALTAGWESHGWGLRLAYDPRQNATATRATRLTLIHRF